MRRRLLRPVRAGPGRPDGRDFRRWERELAPAAGMWVPVVLAVAVAAICALAALIGVAALAVVPFVIVAGAALVICRLLRP